MALVRPFVFQIAGYQNSGKTTLAEAIFRKLKENGIKAASIKHHGHGGKPEIHGSKDSARHIQAGAAASLVEGDGRLLIHSEKDSWQLKEQIEIMSAFKPDVILIEGHKLECYPKFVLIRNSQDEELLARLENIIAAVYWEQEPERKMEFPAYPIKGELTVDFLVRHIMEGIASVSVKAAPSKRRIRKGAL